MSKNEASIEMMDMILSQLPKCPQNDMEDFVREKIVEFNSVEHSNVEKYDFIVEISKEQCDKISDKVCVGYISSFVRELCALDKHYLRPSE